MPLNENLDGMTCPHVMPVTGLSEKQKDRHMAVVGFCAQHMLKAANTWCSKGNNNQMHIFRHGRGERQIDFLFCGESARVQSGVLPRSDWNLAWDHFALLM